MKRSRRIVIKKSSEKKEILNSRLKMHVSEYSQLYRKYMISEFPAAEMMIKKIIQMPACREYYLKFPLEGLLRGTVKRLMLNTYELGVLGYFLEQIEEWSVSTDIILNLYDIFPDVIHVNEPTSPEGLKELSMFLYLACYSVKEFLNPGVEVFRREMSKVFSEFEHLHTHWVNNQTTVNFALNPRALNHYFKKLDAITNMVDYNTCVDKIIQISPCYDLSGKVEKKKIPEFGYKDAANKQFKAYHDHAIEDDYGEIKQEMDNIDLMGEFKFDGGEV